LDEGDDFFEALETFCRTNGIRQGYVPMFLAAFSEAEFVGTCEKLSDLKAPVWSGVHLENVEALGCGTIAYDETENRILPHIHAALGLKTHSATAHTSHLLRATVHFTVEMVVVEATGPPMHRIRDPKLYDVPLLAFGPES
jgi:predicted DNA-binding protein with PD1-like motif